MTRLIGHEPLELVCILYDHTTCGLPVLVLVGPSARPQQILRNVPAGVCAHQFDALASLERLATEMPLGVGCGAGFRAGAFIWGRRGGGFPFGLLGRGRGGFLGIFSCVFFCVFVAAFFSLVACSGNTSLTAAASSGVRNRSSPPGRESACCTLRLYANGQCRSCLGRMGCDTWRERYKSLREIGYIRACLANTIVTYIRW